MENQGSSGVLKQGTTEEKGEMARLSSFVGAMAIADLVASTLGPKGMDKILESMGRSKHVTVTNDGATILKSVYVDNPAARVLVDISKTQDDEVGDGTTTVCIPGDGRQCCPRPQDQDPKATVNQLSGGRRHPYVEY